MGISNSKLHEELRDYVNAHDDFVPSAILDEIRPELDWDLLFRVEDAIKHLKAHVRIVMDDEGDVEVITDPTYDVQQAAVNHALFSSFFYSHANLENRVLLENASISAEATLADEKEEYDRKHEEGASDRLHLFGVDD